MKTVPLGELLEVIIDHRGKTPKKMGSEFTPEGVPVASAQLVSGGVLDLSEARFVDEDTWRRWMPVPVKRGDILLTSEAPLGRVAWIGSNSPLVLGQRLFALRVAHQVVDSRFLGYWLSSSEGQSSLKSHATGSTVSGIRQSALLAVAVPVVDVAVQRGIGEVLGALDDKIAANRRSASALRELQGARWNSVKARLGSARLVEIAPPRLGGTPPRNDSTAWSGPLSWASVRDVTAADEAIILETAERISVDASRSARRLEILPEGTIVLTARGTVGQVAVLGVPAAINQSAYAFVPKDNQRVALRLGIESLADTLKRRAHGSVFSTITISTLSGAKIPDFSNRDCVDVLQEFEHLEDLRVAVMKENLRLATTRDELLPLLMSGKVTVKEAEKAVEEVV